MPAPPRSVLSIATVRLEFERWRAQRRRGARIPDLLWGSAVELAREHGVARTSQALRVDYYSLKARLDRDRASDVDDGMVEITLPIAERSVECVVQLDEGDGRRIRVTLRGGVPEVDRLVASLWGSAR